MSGQEQNGRLQPHHHRLELSPAPQSTVHRLLLSTLAVRKILLREFSGCWGTYWSMIGPKMHKLTFCWQWCPSSRPRRGQLGHQVDTGRQRNRSHFCTFWLKTFKRTRRCKESDCRK